MIVVPATGTRVVKKYGNRRLYDARDSRYINLEELVDLFAAEEDLRVLDAVSGEDLTDKTLRQAVLSGEGRKRGVSLGSRRSAQGAAALPQGPGTRRLRTSPRARYRLFFRKALTLPKGEARRKLLPGDDVFLLNQLEQRLRRLQIGARVVVENRLQLAVIEDELERVELARRELASLPASGVGTASGDAERRQLLLRGCGTRRAGARPP